MSGVSPRLTAEFEVQRPRLEAIAYGMLGMRAEAEDVVQDAWLRLAGTDEDPRELAAWLTAVVTRLSIDRLRLARTRREQYVGPWLPEPLVVDPTADPADVVAEAERLSLGFLAALERLDPVERAVVLLRDGFDEDHATIAPMVGRSVEACRQIAARARTRAASSATRRGRDPSEEQELLDRLLAATLAGDVDVVRELLAADVVSWADSAGEVRAARRPVHGADAVARFLVGMVRRWGDRVVGLARVSVNGDPGVVVEATDGDLSVIAVEVVDGIVVAVRSVRAPDKLRRVRRPAGAAADDAGRPGN